MGCSRRQLLDSCVLLLRVLPISVYTTHVCLWGVGNDQGVCCLLAYTDKRGQNIASAAVVDIEATFTHAAISLMPNLPDISILQHRVHIWVRLLC